MTDKKETVPELTDIEQAIRRYIAAHKGSFVCHFIAEKVSDEKCENCNGECTEVDENKSTMMVQGELEDIRMMLNMLRDVAEDSCDKKGNVSFVPWE